MPFFRRVLVAVAAGALIPCIPAAVHAGGVGGGGAESALASGAPAAEVQVDHTSPPNLQYAYLNYFPKNAVVHVGDSVRFTWASNPLEPHTVTLLPASTPLTDKVLSKLFPNSGTPVPSKKIPGTLEQDLNPDVPAGCGNTLTYPNTAACSYTGRGVVNSGLFIPAHNIAAPRSSYPNPTFTVSMNVAPGTYHYFCLVHGPSMSGTITVVAPGKAIPGAVQNLERANSQYVTASNNAIRAENAAHLPPPQPVGSHHTYLNVTGFGYGQVVQDSFVPTVLNIKAGDSVRWTPGFHTVTFGVPRGASGIGLVCVNGASETIWRGSWANCGYHRLLLYGRAAAPTGPSGAVYTPGTYANSGILVVPQPRTWTMTFTRPGTYTYVCLIHKNMYGTIHVT